MAILALLIRQQGGALNRQEVHWPICGEPNQNAEAAVLAFSVCAIRREAIPSLSERLSAERRLNKVVMGIVGRLRTRKLEKKM